MEAPVSPPALYWKVCLINGAVFVAATALLAVSPATVSYRVTTSELTVLACGLAVILVTDALLLRSSLAPLDRLVQLVNGLDNGGSAHRLPDLGRGVAGRLARSFNDLLDRLERERASRSARELAAQEAERQRIAQELHDEVGQRLTVVLLGIRRAIDKSPKETAEELRLVQENARTSLEEIRRVARGLRPGVLEDLGLIPALAAMTNDVTAQTSLTVRRHFDQSLPALVAEAELVIFRVVQEALTNITRHARADTVDICLGATSELVTLRVTDDGRGMPEGAMGAGIRGMRERALIVGGQLHVGPGGDCGAEVVLHIPRATAVR